MTPEAQLALIAAVPGYLIALGTLIAAVAALRQGQNNAKLAGVNAAVADKKTEVLIQKTDEIHDITNSKYDKIAAELKVSVEQIATLNGIVKTLTLNLDKVAVTEAANTAATRKTGELLTEAENGNTVSYTNLLREIAEMKGILADFAKTGMPVVASDDTPLPVKSVNLDPKKKA